MDNEKCYICYENENTIKICKCNLYVHSKCLIPLLEINKKKYCDICKYKYFYIEQSISTSKIVYIKNIIDSICAITLVITYLCMLEYIKCDNIITLQIKFTYIFIVQILYIMLFSLHIINLCTEELITCVLDNINMNNPTTYTLVLERIDNIKNNLYYNHSYTGTVIRITLASFLIYKNLIIGLYYLCVKLYKIIKLNKNTKQIVNILPYVDDINTRVMDFLKSQK